MVAAKIGALALSSMMTYPPILYDTEQASELGKIADGRTEYR